MHCECDESSAMIDTSIAWRSLSVSRSLNGWCSGQYVIEAAIECVVHTVYRMSSAMKMCAQDFFGLNAKAKEI